MNAIIALCHFCEQHGPRVLFCTQPFHEQRPLHTLMPASVNNVAESLASGSMSSVLHGSRSPRPLLVRSVSVDSDTVSTQESLTIRDRCEGCRSLQSDKPGYISNDREAKVRYVSSQQPHHDELYSIVRQACIRSLSSEVCPGREGPIFFGDSDTRYVLSYTFYLQDTESRGGQRLYSIIVVMMDKIYLLNSWPFLVKHLKNIVRDLQAKSKSVFEKEQATQPTRSLPIRKERGFTAPTQCRLQSNYSSAVRSLLDMTGDQTMFKSLHLAFTWVLKACSNRLTEKLLEGPPTEDSIVDLEQKEEVIDDFVMVGTEKVTPTDTKPPTDPFAYTKPRTESSTDSKPRTASSTESKPRTDSSSTDAGAALGAASLPDAGTSLDAGGNSTSLTDDTYNASLSADPSPIFHNLRELYQRLGYHAFHQLAHHVLIGNQVIVQTDFYRMTKSIIDCLQVLLPKGCCKIIYYSDVYEESWKCNFLGLSKFCLLPKHVVDSEHYALINVDTPVSTSFLPETSLSELRSYKVGLHTGQPPLERASAPKILEKMERAIANLKLNWAVVEQCLICIKEEWMNKVKVLFTFTKAGGNRSEEDTKKLLQMFGASDEDKKALKFWMTGLSAQYKNHMRQTSKHF